MLEPYEGKLSRAVLRGEGGSNTPDLPDDLTGFSGKTLFQSGLLLWSQHFNS